MADSKYSMGPISLDNSQGLVTFDPQLTAMANFERQPVTPAPVSVNAWTHVFEQAEKGRIIGNVVI